MVVVPEDLELLPVLLGDPDPEPELLEPPVLLVLAGVAIYKKKSEGKIGYVNYENETTGKTHFQEP